MHSTSKHALLRLVVAMTAIVAVAAAWSGSALASAHTGTLEICKSSLNGMAGKKFEFSIEGGNTITVRGGRCSGPMQVTAGDVRITETTGEAGGSTDVAAVQVRPSSRLRSSNLPARQVVVNVPLGTTAATETRVTFVNQPAGGTRGDLKICKLSETPAFWGKQFSFTVNGGPAFSTEANPAFADPSTWSCRLAGSFPVGSKVRVQELIPAGAEIAFIDTDPATCLHDFDTNAGYADVIIQAPICIVLVDNEPKAPEGEGWIEVCKDRAKLSHYDWDWDVQGAFEFIVRNPNDEDDVYHRLTVLAGQCSEPLRVPAGIVRVEEDPNDLREDVQLVDVFTIPEDRLLDANLINRTADVEVPVSDNPNDESQVHFVNKAKRAQLKLCKALGPGSSDLIGRRFEFEVLPYPNDRKMLSQWNVSIVAAASTQCVIVGEYTIGEVVSVRELLDGLAEHIQVSGEGSIVIRPGINTLTITNRALGKLEICKFVTDRLVGTEANREFKFRVDGSLIVRVRANRCSEPILVTPGNHTVAEELEANYELDPTAPGGGITVTPSHREVSKNLLARSVTVFVPWASHPIDGGETRVDYYNRIRRGQVKVCKQVSPGSLDALGNKEFDFTVTQIIGGAPNQPTIIGSVDDVRNGECRLLLDTMSRPLNIPIINPNGTPTRIGVREEGAASNATTPGTWFVHGLLLQGSRGDVDTVCSGSPLVCTRFGTDPARAPYTDTGVHIRFNLGTNTNTVHFLNRAGDP